MPAIRPHRRFIACKAEPPTDPSEDFEPVEEELKEGEALEMHLTEAAIKVRRLSVHSFLTTRLFHPLSFRSVGSVEFPCSLTFYIPSQQIERAQAKANDPTLSLRLIVESGGCHGYQYKMQVTNKRDSDD